MKTRSLSTKVRARERRWRASARPRATATGRLRQRAPPVRPRACRSAARVASRPAAVRSRTRGGAAGARHHLARVEARIVGAHRAHADRHSIDARPQLVHEAAALLALTPSATPAPYAAVERHRDLVRHERPALDHPRAPRLVLRSAFEGVESSTSMPAARSCSRPPPESAPGSRQPATTLRTPAASTASTHGGVRP